MWLDLQTHPLDIKRVSSGSGKSSGINTLGKLLVRIMLFPHLGQFTFNQSPYHAKFYRYLSFIAKSTGEKGLFSVIWQHDAVSPAALHVVT